MLHSSKIGQFIEDDGCVDHIGFSPKVDVTELKDKPTASVDLRLGGWFVFPKITKQHLLDAYHSAQSNLKDKIATSKYYVPFGERFILHPKSFVLAATLEWICLPNTLGGYVSGKSSWGRRGLVIETAPGVHPGFSGCLTLELANIGEIPIALRPGMKICQLFIHRLEAEEFGHARSDFDGRRQPVLGAIAIDPFAKNLFDIDKG
jgi:dCTP deaminase